MPRYIIKLTDQEESWYLEWSTIVDAPVTYGMSYGEFLEWYKEEYGRQGMEDLPDRLARVEKTGTSSRFNESLEDLISYNRAGPKETCLTLKELIETYCRRKAEC